MPPCMECFRKQQRLDRLEEENRRLKEKLRYEEKKAHDGFLVPQPRLRNSRSKLIRKFLWRRSRAGDESVMRAMDDREGT